MSTLKEIASKAGVHTSTASAVLNAASGNTRVSPETRQRVQEIAKELFYVPNESARRLRRGRSETVGFLGGDLRNPFFSELAAALEEELNPSGLKLMVSHISHSEISSKEEAIESLRQQGIQNIVCWEEAPAIAGRASDPHLPPLSIGFTSRTRPGVWLDLDKAVALSADKMVRGNFKQLGFFAPHKQQESPSVNARSKIFLQECKKRGLPLPALVTYTGESWDLDAATRGARIVLKSHSHIEAWVGFNDIAAIGLLSQLRQKDASRVLCFDGTAVARSWPGNPPRLDLKIRELARKTASVIRGDETAKDLGQRKNWLIPNIVN